MPSAIFTAPEVDADTAFTFTLNVTDGLAYVHDAVTVTVRDVPDPFVTTWRTVSANQTITIPVGGSAGNYTVDWGDGTTPTTHVADATHTYATAGDHAVSISGDFGRIHMGGTSPANANRLVSIDQWGDIKWTTMDGAFENASLMVYNAADIPDLSGVASMAYMFAGARYFNSDISTWDVSPVTDMTGMFAYAGAFNQSLNSWNISGVTDMTGMFEGAVSFNHPLDRWDVSSVGDMNRMFTHAFSFDQNLGNWYIVLDDTTLSDVNETLAMSAQNPYLDGQSPTYAVDDARFAVAGGTLAVNPSQIPPAGAYNVTIASAGGFGTGNSKVVEIAVNITQANSPPTVEAGADQAVNEGETVTLAGSADGDILTYSWNQTSGPPTADLLGADTPSPAFTAPAVSSDTRLVFELTVSDGSGAYADAVTVTVQDVPARSDFVTTWQTTTAGESITIPVGGATGTYTVHWGDGTVEAGVSGDRTHAYRDAGTYTVKISGDFGRIFLNSQQPNANRLASIEQWGDIRWESMNSAFNGASNMVYRATDVPDLSRVTDARYMFYRAESFDGNLSGWDVSRVTDMFGMFWRASSFNGDLSGWDVSRVTDMALMFTHAASFNADISGWDASRVTDMTSMFWRASSFNGDLSGWDVSSVARMAGMFAQASTFNSDISGWNVSSVTDMAKMFDTTYDFAQNLGNWYIVLDDTTLSDVNETLAISAQNPYLDGQSPTYAVDDARFAVAGGTLAVNPSQIPPAGAYNVTIASAGGFGTGNSKVVEIAVNITQANSPPTVEAGADQAVNEGQTVTLSGTATDPDLDDILAYSWSQDSPAAPTIAFANSTSPSATFTAPEVDVDTPFTLTLNVTDGTVHVHDTVTIAVRDVPDLDVADVTSITPDGPYHPGQTVDVRINFTKPVNLEAFTIHDGGRDAAGGTFTELERASGVTVIQRGSSHYALVAAARDHGIEIIDITDPASPSSVAALSHSPTYPKLQGVYSIAITQIGSSHYALATAFSNNGVQIIDITDLARPAPVAALSDGPTYWKLEGAYSIAITQIGSSHYALVAASTEDGVQIIDITDPANPAPVAALSHGSTYPKLRTPNSITTTQIGSSHYALVASSYGDGVQIIDITDPANPAPVAALSDGSTYRMLRGASSITTAQIGSSLYALVASYDDDGVQIIDITDPARPAPVAALSDGPTYPELAGANSITTAQIGSSHYALVTAARDDGVQIIDITDPARPAPVAALSQGPIYPELGAPYGITTTRIGSSHYALVAAQGDGVQIIDITDPANPFNPLLPYVGLDLAGDRRAAYTGQANGNHTLVFEYVIQDGDLTGDLAYSGTGALVLGHSTLTDPSASTSHSNVILPEPGAPHSLSHNKQIALSAWPNNPPTVYAGANRTANGGETVALAGSAADADGDTLTYQWAHDSSLAIEFANSTLPSTTFAAPQVDSDTTVTFTLTADDGTHTSSDAVAITVLDATAGSNDLEEDEATAVLEPAAPPGPRDIGRITLNSAQPGTIQAAWDAPSEAPVDYRISWAKAGESYRTWSDPAGNAYPTGPSQAITDLEEDEQYNVKVRARYGGTSGDWSGEITITVVASANSPPTVDAGADQAVNEGTPVTLSGTATDPDGNPLTYSWTHDSALDIGLTGADTASVSFTAPQVAASAIITFTLTADDGTHTSSDAVAITVLDATANSPPTVDAGADQAVDEGTPVTLSGTATDPDGNPLTYSWTHDSALDIGLTGADTASVSFTAPQVAASAIITFTLTADDGTHTSSDAVAITILDATANSPPAVDAGADQAVNEGTPVTLSGTATDPDGNPLTYSWTHDSALDIGLTGADTASVSFTAPQVAASAIITFTLTADDGTHTSSDAVAITILDATANSPPAVDAGADQAVNEGTPVTLSGTATDPDGNPLTYSWTHDSALDIGLTGADTASVSFTAPQVAASAIITFTLTADDGTHTSSDAVAITILDATADSSPTPNQAPEIVDMGGFEDVPGFSSIYEAEPGDTVRINPTVRDADGDELTFTWELLAVYGHQISDDAKQAINDAVRDDGEDASFTAPAVPQDRESRLLMLFTVSDGNSDTIGVAYVYVSG